MLRVIIIEERALRSSSPSMPLSLILVDIVRFTDVLFLFL